MIQDQPTRILLEGLTWTLKCKVLLKRSKPLKITNDYRSCHLRENAMENGVY